MKTRDIILNTPNLPQPIIKNIDFDENDEELKYFRRKLLESFKTIHQRFIENNID